VIVMSTDGKRADAKARRERRARGDGDTAGDRARAFNQPKSRCHDGRAERVAAGIQRGTWM
jgi:hypothetical protein